MKGYRDTIARDAPAPQRRHKAGMSLIEVLACVAVIAVVTNLAGGAFISSMRLSKMGKAAALDLETLDAIRHDFIDVVRTSSGVCEQAGTYRSGPDRVVLELPPRTEWGEARRYAVFGRLDDGQRLFKRILVDEGDGAIREGHLTSYHRDFGMVRFDYSPPGDLAQVRLLTLTLEAPPPDRGKRKPAVHTCTAAVRHIGRKEPVQ